MTSGRELRRHFALAALLAAPFLFVYAMTRPTPSPSSASATAAPALEKPIVSRADTTPSAEPGPSCTFVFVKPDEVAIDGTVVAPDGTPVADAQVLVQLAVTEPMPRDFRASTGADGRFRVAAPRDSPVVLRVVTPTWPSHGFRHPLERVRVPAGGTTALIVRLRAGSRIAGRVVDGGGDAVGGLRLRTAVPSAMSSGDFVAAESVTAADGWFAFDGLAGGFWTIQEDLPAGSTADHLLLDVSDVSTGTMGLFVRRLPVAAVTGRVIDADGRPAANRTVVLVRKGAALTAETRTDAAGCFRATVVEPGTYVVRLRFATQSGHADRDMGEIDASVAGEHPFVAPAPLAGAER